MFLRVISCNTRVYFELNKIAVLITMYYSVKHVDRSYCADLGETYDYFLLPFFIQNIGIKPRINQTDLRGNCHPTFHTTYHDAVSELSS